MVRETRTEHGHACNNKLPCFALPSIPAGCVGCRYDSDTEQERDPREAEAPCVLDEGYVKVPHTPQHSPAESSPLALQPLGPNYPAPLSRVVVRDAHVYVAFCSDPDSPGQVGPVCQAAVLPSACHVDSTVMPGQEC